MRPRWVSFSSLDQFLKCERQWFYRRIKKLPEKPSFYLAIGNLYHEVLQWTVELGLGPSGREDLIDRLFVEHASRPTWSCPTKEEVLKKEIYTNVSRVQYEVIEPMRKAGADFECEKSHKYLAKIDLLTSMHPEVSMGEVVGVTDQPGVLDYKIKFSTYNRRSQGDADLSAQLAMYCILEGVSWAGFVEIPRSIKAPVNVIAKSFSAEELKWWERYLDSQTASVNLRRYLHANMSEKELEAGFRLASPDSTLCSEKWCSFYNRCPGGGKKF
jgi:hypothetical protein